MARKLAPPAPYRRFLATYAMLADKAGNYQVSNKGGSLVDTVAVMTGEWIVRDATGVSIEAADSFKERFERVPDHPGIYGNRENLYTHRTPVEIVRAPMGKGPAAARFARQYHRCGLDGRLLGPLDASLDEQAGTLRECGLLPDVLLHLAVLREMGYGEALVEGSYSRFDLGVASIAMKALDDGLPLLHWARLTQAGMPGAGTEDASNIFAGLGAGSLENVLLAFSDASGYCDTRYAQWIPKRYRGHRLPMSADLRDMADRWDFSASIHSHPDARMLIVKDRMGCRFYAWPA